MSAGTPERVAGVSRVLEYLNRVVKSNKVLASLRVRGEVSGMTTGGAMVHFTLKEGADVLQCVVWANDLPKLQPFRDGDEVICGGDFSAYSRRSQFQLMVRRVELTGAGAIYAALKALEERFRREGLFARERKRPMPAFPRRLAVVSSRESRGMNDFLTTLSRRAPFIQVLFIDTRVQGDGAEIEIAEAIDKASKMDVDVTLLTRGGGSVEDLYPFNKEPVVRAIVRSKHPVMTAIGHNLDIHVSDQVADYHCETPSNAAQYFGEIRDRFATGIERAQARLERAVRERSVDAGQHLELLTRDLRYAAQTYVPQQQARIGGLERRLELRSPAGDLAKRRNRLTGLRSRLETLSGQGTSARLQRARDLRARLGNLARSGPARARSRLEVLHAQLNGLDPEAPLQRGYAIVSQEGRPIRSAAEVNAGTRIEARVLHGRLTARVEEVLADG